MAGPDSTTRHHSELEDPFGQFVAAVRDYAIFLLDRNGQILSWNDGAQLLKGYSAAEAIGRNFSMFYVPEDVKRCWPAEELKIAAERGRLEDEGWRVRKDGSRFWANVIITAMRDGQGELRGFFKVTRDLTERWEREEALRESEARFRGLVETINDYAIFMLDPEGLVISWNAGAERIMGYRAPEITGRNFSMLYTPGARDQKWPEQQLAMAREQGRFQNEEQRIRRNGTEFVANVVITPLYRTDGGMYGYATMILDLSDRKRADALERTTKHTNEFLAMLAHEVRNALAPTRNALHLLVRRPASDPTEQHAREILERQTAQLSQLVDNLVDTSRITDPAKLLHKELIDLRMVVQSSVDASKQWLESEQRMLEVNLPAHELPVIGDAVRLREVMQDLLHNAGKYTPPRATITVTAELEGDQVVIAVRGGRLDMTLETAKPAPELARQHEGLADQASLGMGLSTAQRLVMLHGGTVEADNSHLVGGSAFIVRLPARKSERRATPYARNADVSPITLHRVLIVDDNQDAANTLRLLLEDDGHDVTVATDGPSGLALARHYKPDYLLLDIALPRLSGYEIAASVRADPALKAIKIVAVTGYGQVHDRARTTAAGFDHHLTKPVEFGALQRLLNAGA